MHVWCSKLQTRGKCDGLLPIANDNLLLSSPWGKIEVKFESKSRIITDEKHENVAREMVAILSQL